MKAGQTTDLYYYYFFIKDKVNIGLRGLDR